MNAKIIALVKQKGGVGKTTTTVNLGIGLAMLGNRVLLVDADAQGNLTDSLVFHEPDNLPISLATVLSKSMPEEPFIPEEGILHHAEALTSCPATLSFRHLRFHWSTP